MKLTDIAKNKPILEARKPMSVETAGEENMAQAKAMRPQFTDKQIKMAFGILNDPRYKDGNYDGAHATIEKLAKGLSQHPSVANAMKRANEDIVTEGSYLYLNGKEIDQSTVIYDMQDYSDGMFELHGANYADGTELDEKELEELESTQELIDWVMIDFVEEGRSNENVQQQRKDDMYNAQAGVKKSSGNKKPGLQGKELADYRAKRVAEYEADLVKKRAENAARLKSYGEAVNPMVPFGNTKRKSTSHKQSKISSSEYQKVKKRKDFNASDWKWDGDQDLYVRESVTEMNKYGLTAVNKEGKFYAFRHGKMVGGPFDTMQELSDFQLKSIENEDTDTAIPYTFTKKDFEDNEDANMHTENGMEIAKMFGTPQEVKRMEMIMKAHNQRGHILGDEQAERNAIVSKYYDMLEGLDEGMMSDMEKDLIDMYKGDGEPGLADAMGMSEKEFAQAYTKAGSDIQKMIKNYVNANEDINVEIPEDMYERISNYSTSLNEAVKDTLMGVEDPVIVITNAQGKIVDKLQMSIAAKKYKFNMTFIRPQFKHQGNVKHGQFTLSAPMAGQPMEGYSILPDMPEKYVARDGLEGPIMTRSGKVVYYDNVEGKYYDPDTDIYLTYDEWKAFDPELPIKSEAIDAVLAQADGYSVVKDDGDDIHIMYNDEIIGGASFDSGSDSFWVSLPGKTSEGGQESFDTAQDIIDYYAQNKITEIASPDEQATHSNVALDTLRKIVADKQNMPVKFADGQMNVDLYSASAITQVFDKINPQNQAKLLGMMGTKAGMIKVTNLVFGMMNKKGDHSVAETEGPVSEYTGNSIGVKEMEQMLVTLADKKVNSTAYQRFISGSDKYKADPALAKELEGDKKKLAADVNESVELDRIKYLSGL